MFFQTRLSGWATVGALALGVVAGSVAFVAESPQAQAQDKYELAYTTATGHYDTLRIQEAESVLENAVSLAAREGVRNRAVARLHVMLGIVRHAVTQDQIDAYEQFVEALLIDRSITIDPDYQTPTLTEIFERAKSELPADTKNDERPVEVVGLAELKHDPVRTVQVGQGVQFSVEVPSSLPLYRVMLNYRAYGTSEFSSQEMRPDSTTRFVADLPGTNTKTSQLDYFIEVLDRTGQILANSGAPDAPHQIVVIGGEDDLPPEEPEPGTSDNFMYIMLMSGGGVGVATGTPQVESDVELNPGLAPGFMNFVGEIGLELSPELNIGAFYRMQYEPALGATDHMGGAKFRWFLEHQKPLRFYTQVGAGYGHVRHTVNLAPKVDFVDTTLEGPIHGGVGFGAAYAFNNHFMLVADLYTMFLFPQISGHLDANAGFRVAF